MEKKTATEVTETVETVKAPETPAKVPAAKPAKKKFAPSDLIPCVSITPGEMFFSGEKSKILYTWADADDVVEIEFRDLDYAARTKNGMMYRPRFIVQDKDFLELHKGLEDVYGDLYSMSDLKNILKESASKMEKLIKALPEGAKDALKKVAATMVDNGTLDSVQRIRVLDSLFDTELLIKVMSR